MNNLIPNEFSVVIRFEQKSLITLAGVIIVILFVAFIMQKILKGV